jgi:hypothetical protein
VTLPKYFSHPSLVIYFFATPPIKVKTGPQICGGYLLIANHLDQSLCLTNQKQGAAVRSYLVHSSLAGAQLCWAFYQPQPAQHICRSKTNFTEINRHILTILQLILMFRVTYCAQVGDAQRAASPVTLNRRSKETIVTAQIS